MLRDKMRIVANDLRAIRAIAGGRGRLSPRQRFKVTIEATSTCNLHCPLCPTGTGKLKRSHRFVPVETFERIVEVTRPVADGYVLSMWGEPVLHPRLSELLDKTRSLPTWISTNLNYKESLARELARWDNLNVICAVDTLDPDAYARYRVGGDYGVVLRNLEILAAGACHVYPQFLIGEGEDIAKYTEFPLRFGIPAGNAVIKIKRANFTLGGEGRPAPGKCHAAFMGLYFDSDGYLLPCCNDVRRDLRLGHIDDLDLDDILNDENIAGVRRGLSVDKNRFPSCHRCRGETWGNIRWPVYVESALRRLRAVAGKARGPQKMPFREPDEQD